MSNTKIVIDKEAFETKILGWIRRRNYVTSSDLEALLNGLTTTIQLDESIEARAEKEYPDVNCEDVSQQKITDSFNRAKRKHFIKGATSQKIIESMKGKEKEGFEFISECVDFSMKISHIKESPLNKNYVDNWINISDKKPDYYKVVLCQDNEGNICACWRACSDDLEDMYTINKSDNLLQNVVKWKII